MSLKFKEQFVIGIEGGGTRTTAVACDLRGNTLQQQEFSPGNVRLMDNNALARLFGEIRAAFGQPVAIGVGMAGMREEADRTRVRKASAEVWGSVPLAVTHDLEIALRAAEPGGAPVKVLVLSGTGSCCFAQSDAGATAKVGGWGHLLGDRGSGYDIALQGLRAAVYRYERKGEWGALGGKVLSQSLLNAPEDLIAWAQSGEKRLIASLSPVVFAAAAEGDRDAGLILNEAAESLAFDALECASRVAGSKEAVRLVFAGGVFQRQPRFARKVFVRVRQKRARTASEVLQHSGAIGAARMALALTKGQEQSPESSSGANIYVPPFEPGTSPTEARNPKSMRLDRLTVKQAVALMLNSEAEVVPALRREERAIVRAVNAASATINSGGRIFYVGAGTSGRLGVLDASECPPTFRVAPDLVQGIIAGGQRALWQAVEGAEDDATAGASAIRFRGVTSRDLVIGIAASGRTPFVWGAFAEAKRIGARRVLVCFNPALKIARAERPEMVIAANLGAEILTGSTRLKCGTATKLILNAITTLSMVKAGKVVSNLMVDLNPSNVKLRDRAVRIVTELTNCTSEEAQGALQKTGWVVKRALKALRPDRFL